MATPGGGFPPRAPTLEEIIKIFGIARNFEFSHSFETDDIRVSFKVNKKDCEDADIGVSMFASVFLAETKEHLARLSFFEDLVKKYCEPDIMGSTSADCIAYLRNQLKNLKFTGTLEAKLQKSFFETIIKKLTELGEWRTFADAARFEKLREQEEAIRRQQDAARKAQQEHEKRQRKKSWQQEEFNSAFDDLRDAFRHTYNFKFDEDPDEHFRKHNYGHKPPKAGGNWWEILGVPANATRSTIKSAWRKLAKRYHPDREGGDSTKMAEINAAKDEGISGANS